MRRAMILLAAITVVPPLAGQARRAAPQGFPLSVTGSLVLNAFGVRAEELDAILLQCTTAANCIEHSMARGPGAGAAIQVPIARVLALGAGLDAVTMLRRQCIPGGNCSVNERLLGLRARGELLFRLKARAPVFFGIGAAAMRTDPGGLEPQSDPTTDVGAVVTIGGDFAAGPRTSIRVTWQSFFLKADDTGLPTTFESRTAHDAVLAVGVRYALTQ